MSNQNWFLFFFHLWRSCCCWRLVCIIESPAGATLKSCLIWWLDQRGGKKKLCAFKIQIFGSCWCAACNCGCGFDLIVQWRQWNRSFNRDLFFPEFAAKWGLTPHKTCTYCNPEPTAAFTRLSCWQLRTVAQARLEKEKTDYFTLMPGFVFLNLFFPFDGFSLGGSLSCTIMSRASDRRLPRLDTVVWITLIKVAGRKPNDLLIRGDLAAKRCHFFFLSFQFKNKVEIQIWE